MAQGAAGNGRAAVAVIGVEELEARDVVVGECARAAVAGVLGSLLVRMLVEEVVERTYAATAGVTVGG